MEKIKYAEKMEITHVITIHGNNKTARIRFIDNDFAGISGSGWHNEDGSSDELDVGKWDYDRCMFWLHVFERLQFFQGVYAKNKDKV